MATPKQSKCVATIEKDFDAALQNPEAPLEMLPRYDSGDGLHPGDTGYEAMANTLDLELLQVAEPGNAR